MGNLTNEMRADWRKSGFDIPDVEDKPKVKRKPAPLIEGVPEGPLPGVKRSAFRDKKSCGEIENIIWVCDNMRIVDVDAKDCPSLRAWNLLCECREDPGFRRAFWKDHYGKTVPAKSHLSEDDGKRKDDGKVSLAIIEKLLSVSEKAKKGG